MSESRLLLLQIFNRYLQYGGEEGSITRIGDAIQKIHDVDYFFYSTSQLSGETLWDKAKMPWKSFHNTEVADGLKRLKESRNYDAWQIHNIFPAMSPVVYELALKWKMPIIQYLHNYRFSCVNGFYLNHGQPCQRCISGNFWPAFQTACWRHNRLQSGWMGLITHRVRQLPIFEKIFCWIAISEAQRQEHIRMGIPAERIRVVHHFLDVDSPPLPPAASPTAIFVGRLSQEKGVHRLIEAWKKIAGGERMLLIMGDGPERANLERQAEGVRGIHFLGFVSGKEQQRYWQEALFSVVPSVWLEPFGMTVLESWSHARPVVGHAIGALPELIQDGVNGALADPSNVDDLAEKMDHLLSNAHQTKTMGLAGRRNLEENFNQQVWLRNIAVIYNELMASR